MICLALNPEEGLLSEGKYHDLLLSIDSDDLWVAVWLQRETSHNETMYGSLTHPHPQQDSLEINTLVTFRYKKIEIYVASVIKSP